MYDLIVVGGGPAGYSAALYGARLKLKVLVLTQERGGRLKLTDLIENYPGAPSISGTELMDIMEKQATQFGGEIRDEKVEGLIKDGENIKVVTEKGEYITKTILIATGVNLRKLNVPGEKEFENKGVSYCAVCDGALFSGRVVSVVGGSDAAAKEALLLTQYAKKVYIIYRGEQIHPEPITLDRINEKAAEGKIEIINNANVKEIKGEKLVTHVVLDREYKGSRELKVDGVFIEIGGTPGSLMAESLGVNLDERGYVIIDEESKTNIPNVFAAGDVTSTKWKQGIVAASQGSYAAFSAYLYIKSKGK